MLDRGIKLATPERDPDYRYEFAGVLGATKRYVPAIEITKDLLKKEPENTPYRIRLAELTLGTGEIKTGLAMVDKLIQEDFKLTQLWAPFVNAAAALTDLSPEEVQFAAKLAGETIPRFAEKEDEIAYLGRLGLVLVREGNRTRNKEMLATANRLVDRALALAPKTDALRREMAGILWAVGKTKEGLALMEGLKLTAQDRFNRAKMFTDVKDFSQAEQEVKMLLSANPTDAKAQALMAQVMLWSANKDPERISKALALLESRLKDNFEQPELWGTFIDAVSAGSKDSKMSDSQKELALKIAGQPYEKFVDLKDPAAMLSRLAWAFYQAGDKDRSKDFLDKAVALHPTDPDTLKELAGVLTGTNAAGGMEGFKTALALLKDLADKNPNDLDLQAQVAQNKLWSEDRLAPSRAFKWFSRRSSISPTFGLVTLKLPAPWRLGR